MVVPGAQAKDLSFVDGSGSCTVYKVASDGVWHSDAFTTHVGPAFELTGASRADFAIKCSAGTSTIKWAQGTAATIEAGVGLDGHGMPGNDDLGSAPAKPAALQNIDTATPIDDTFVVQLSGGGINGQKWDENDLVTGLGVSLVQDIRNCT